MNKLEPATIRLIYDGECPVCSAYSRVYRLRESVGALQLINARAPLDETQRQVLQHINQRGFDLDQGMVLIVDTQYYHAGQAMQVLAMLGSRSGWFNRFNYWIFRSPRRTRLLYPLLRAGRNGLLKLLGRRKLNNL